MSNIKFDGSTHKFYGVSNVMYKGKECNILEIGQGLNSPFYCLLNLELGMVWAYERDLSYVPHREWVAPAPVPNDKEIIAGLRARIVELEEQNQVAYEVAKAVREDLEQVKAMIAEAHQAWTVERNTFIELLGIGSEANHE